MRRNGILSPLWVVLLPLVAFGQDEGHPAFTARDAILDGLLEEAAQFERRGEYDYAVKAYLRVEAQLSKERLKDPRARPTTEVGPGLDRGVGLYVRDRIAQLPEDAIQRYRQSIDPRAAQAFEVALATGVPERLEQVIARYPLSTVVGEILPRLAELAIERGELGRAIRAYRRLEARLSDPARARKVALLRAFAALARRDAAEAQDALGAYAKHGGDTSRKRMFGGREVALSRLVGELRSSVGSNEAVGLQEGFDPGGLGDVVDFEKAELPTVLAEKLAVPSAHQQGVFDPGTGLLFVADYKTVRAVPVGGKRGVRGWIHSVIDPESEPSRLEVAALRPALGPGLLFATLHRNRPARLEVKEEMVDDKPEEKVVVHRRKDWRVVALDRKSGKKVWDAAEHAGFESLARDAEWVSAPLYFEGGVYVTVLERAGDVRASLVRLDAGSGDVQFRTFLVSRSAYDHLGLGSPPPAPTTSPRGHVIVATGLGAAAAIHPSQGEVVWIARYPVTPQGSEPTIVLSGRRFRSSTPLGERSPLVVAPVDGVDVVAFDADTGRLKWSAPRSDARLCVAGPGGRVLLLGRRLVARDRETGRVLFRGPVLDEEVIASPAVYGKELVAVTGSSLLRLSLADGSVLARYRFENPALEVGAAVALSPGRLATVAFGRLNIYSSLDRALKELADKYGDRPQRRVFEGQLRARRDEVYKALTHLQKALRSGLTQTGRHDAQKAAIQLMVREAERRASEGDVRGFLARAERVIYFLGAVGTRAADLNALDLELLSISAATLRRYADRHAAGGDAKAWVKAASAYQRMLWTSPGTLVRLDQGTEVEARGYARSRVRELVEAHGAKIYSAFEGPAADTYRRARETRSTTDYRRIVEYFPASAVAADAHWYLASQLDRAELRGDALGELQRFVRNHPKDPRVPEALARQTALAERLQRLAEARHTLSALTAIEPEPMIPGLDGGPKVGARAWAKVYEEKLFKGLSEAALQRAEATAGLEPPLTRVYRGVTELSQDGAELIAVDAPSGNHDFFVLRRGVIVEVRRVPDGGLVRQVSQKDFSGRLKPGLLASSILIGHEDSIESYALSGQPTAGPAWRFTVSTQAVGERVGPNAVHAMRVTEDTAYVLTGTNELLALDAKGAQRWRLPLPFKATGGLFADEAGVLVYSMSPARLALYSEAEGKLLWSHDPALKKKGQQIRIGNLVRMGDTLLAVEDGQRVVGLDAAKGTQRWEVAGDGAWILELLPSIDGRLAITRTHGPLGAGLRVYDVVLGKEVWRDNGNGVEQPGAMARPGGGSALNRVAVGEDTLYSFRTTAGRAELWAQDLRSGKKSWTWRLPAGSRAAQAIETPTSILIPRSGVIGRRATLSVLTRGGKLVSNVPVAGRRLLGLAAIPVAGVLVVSTDRGVMCFSGHDRDGLARETVDLARALEKDASNDALRIRLAQRLERLGRREAALNLLEDGLLAEGLRTAAFDRLFERLTAMSESRSEEEPLKLGIRPLPRPPEIDGELADWWRPWSSVALEGPLFVQPIQQLPGQSSGRWTGREDLSAKLYMGWDEKNFYFALDVKDTNLRPYDSEAENWIGDCLLIAIDTQNNGGEAVLGDDVLLSLALTLPKKKDEEEEEEEEEEEGKKPDGRYFVRKKEDNSGAIYECAIPWEVFSKNGAAVDPIKGPKKGFSFGFNVILTDDDGDRFDGTGPDSKGPRGALKTLELTPGVLLHQEKSRLWQGYIPRRFAKVSLQ